ncbi:hypothetical protein EON65_30260 [archaeon]|nr:MAG: hypothetical protein EON65_30260 [archaeon]
MAFLSFSWRDLHYKVTPLRKRSVNEYLLREHLRISGKDANFVNDVHQAHIHTQDLLNILLHNRLPSTQPSEEFLGDQTPYSARLSTLQGGETQQGIDKLQLGLLLMNYPDTFASSLVLASVYSILSELQMLDIKQPHNILASDKQLGMVGSEIARALQLSVDDYPIENPSDKYKDISQQMPVVTDRVLGKVEELLEVMEHFQFNLQDVSGLSLPMLNGHQLKQVVI